MNASSVPQVSQKQTHTLRLRLVFITFRVRFAKIIHAVIRVSPNTIVDNKVVSCQPTFYNSFVLILGNLIVDSIIVFDLKRG